jgi:hypothetical protein
MLVNFSSSTKRTAEEEEEGLFGQNDVFKTNLLTKRILPRKVRLEYRNGLFIEWERVVHE